MEYSRALDGRFINIPRERSGRVTGRRVSAFHTTERARVAIYFRRDLLHPIELRAADSIRAGLVEGALIAPTGKRAILIAAS